MRHFDVRDPFGFTHRVGIDSAGLHGAENLWHHVGEFVNGDKEAKRKLVNAIATALVYQRQLPDGFTAQEVACP